MENDAHMALSANDRRTRDHSTHLFGRECFTIRDL